MSIRGLAFVFAALDDIEAGLCAACGRPLPAPPRSHEMTCDALCHRLWIERLVQQYGETKRITNTATGKTYLVPTRDILEHGITGASLVTYPETPA